MYGYNDVVLEVDLSSQEISERLLSPDAARLFIGGKGLGAHILYNRFDPGCDPLGPKNVFIMAVGPLTASRMQTSGRWCVVTKSPQTGAFLDSQIGGHFGAALKGAGFDLVVITGRAKRPVYLVLENGTALIEDAEALWGKGILETTEILSERYPGAHVSSIGPAGERQVLYSCIGVDRYRQAGRGGTGAVWGSKNLKAVVVKGSWQENPADPVAFAGAVAALLKEVRESDMVKMRRDYGTPLWVDVVNEAGLLPTYNFKEGRFNAISEITAYHMKQKIVTGNRACYNCAIACGKLSRVEKGPFRTEEIEGPEYETIALLGSNCGIGSIEALAYLNWLCDDLGLDTISTGNVIGFVMEAAENGVRGAPDIRFGDAQGTAHLIASVTKREGVGDLLAQGVRAIASEWRQGTERYAMHVKGMEIPGYDPRGTFGMSLAYATSDRGACHQRAWTVNAELTGELSPPLSYEGRAKYVKNVQDRNAITSSLLRCDFCPCSDDLSLELLNSMTGFGLTREDYAEAGERIWNQVRLFNVREGFTVKDDVLPARLFEEALDADGQMRLDRDGFEAMLSEYYALREWDENGIPRSSLLNRLGLPLLSDDNLKPEGVAQHEDGAGYP